MKRLFSRPCSGGLRTPALAQEDGQTAFNTSCRTCHTMKEGDNRQGRALQASSAARRVASGFNYSPSMKQSGITWDEATLDQFIADPEQVVHGNT